MTKINKKDFVPIKANPWLIGLKRSFSNYISVLDAAKTLGGPDEKCIEHRKKTLGCPRFVRQNCLCAGENKPRRAAVGKAR